MSTWVIIRESDDLIAHTYKTCHLWPLDWGVGIVFLATHRENITTSFCWWPFINPNKVKVGQFEYLLWEYHQNNILFRQIVSFGSIIGVDIGISIFIFVKFRPAILRYFQTNWQQWVNSIVMTCSPGICVIYSSAAALWMTTYTQVKYQSEVTSYTILKIVVLM